MTSIHSFKNSTAYDVYENPFAERVNGIIKNEYLIPYGVNSFERLQILLPKAVSLYNDERPHGSFLFDTPSSFESKFSKK
ncbi:integrase core domain-containing protein [Leptospira santarosai]|uniref:integrase core domain-containing protein n=1 Tax=Leptospira santarosai TaxID=28183 RepID=UPI0030B9B38C